MCKDNLDFIQIINIFDTVNDWFGKKRRKCCNAQLSGAQSIVGFLISWSKYLKLSCSAFKYQIG